MLSTSYAELQSAGLSETCRTLAGYAYADAQQEASAINRFTNLVNDADASDEAVEAARVEMEHASAVAVGSYERYRTVHLTLRCQQEQAG